MKALDRFTKGDMHGIHYAVSIFFATAMLWFLLRRMTEANPIWAISSMVATSDPAMKQAMQILRARITNALADAWWDSRSSPSAERGSSPCRSQWR